MTVLWSLGNDWYIFPRFGILCLEKSGSPGLLTASSPDIPPDRWRSRHELTPATGWTGPPADSQPHTGLEANTIYIHTFKDFYGNESLFIEKYVQDLTSQPVRQVVNITWGCSWSGILFYICRLVPVTLAPQLCRQTKCIGHDEVPKRHM
jgi:hypothetical protein